MLLTLDLLLVCSQSDSGQCFAQYLRHLVWSALDMLAGLHRGMHAMANGHGTHAGLHTGTHARMPWSALGMHADLHRSMHAASCGQNVVGRGQQTHRPQTYEQLCRLHCITAAHSPHLRNHARASFECSQGMRTYRRGEQLLAADTSYFYASCCKCADIEHGRSLWQGATARVCWPALPTACAVGTCGVAGGEEARNSHAHANAHVCTVIAIEGSMLASGVSH
jgi:hypothetical protein